MPTLLGLLGFSNGFQAKYFFFFGWETRKGSQKKFIQCRLLITSSHKRPMVSVTVLDPIFKHWALLWLGAL